MRFFALVLSCFFASALALLAGDKALTSPLGTFTIAQHCENEAWTSTLHFKVGNHPDIMLTNDFLWPANFHVSPDEKWILQTQKSGSGENIAFLYHLDSNGCLWRRQQRFEAAAFAFLEQSLKIALADLYHTAVEFKAWDTKAGLLRFMIGGSFVEKEKSGAGVERELIYHLNQNSFSIP